MHSKLLAPSPDEITELVTQLAEAEGNHAPDGLLDPTQGLLIASWQRSLPDVAVPVEPSADC